MIYLFVYELSVSMVMMDICYKLNDISLIWMFNYECL